MITYLSSEHSIFDAPTKILVNPVNCEAVWGKGLALEFKKRFPSAFNYHERYVKILPTDRKIETNFTWSFDRKTFIVLWPTKVTWREKSSIEILRKGFETFLLELDDYYPTMWDVFKIPKNEKTGKWEVAIPALGCGEGGLKWEDVKKLFEEYLSDLPEVDFLIYEPKTPKGLTS